MISKQTPLIAAIPNYNMASSLESLLPQLLQQEYDAIYVLDDSSTDNTKEIVDKFGKKVHLIEGDKNIGAAGNRNRVLPKIKGEAIIHFIDADTSLKTPLTKKLAIDLMSLCEVGFIGGTIYDLKGRPHMYNYGPRLGLRNDISSLAHLFALKLGQKFPKTEQSLRKTPILNSWPNPRQKLRRREVYWTAEANLLILASTLRSINGFDDTLRDHDILDLSIRIHEVGLKCFFDPRFAVIHKEINVRTGNRLISMWKAEAYIARKHGLLSWFT